MMGQGTMVREHGKHRPVPRLGHRAAVNITSWPRAAEVVINGKVSGVTPTTVSLPSVKPADITVRMSGYAAVVERSSKYPSIPAVSSAGARALRRFLDSS
ncbi:MAG TPA: PEGA domain-containing protein [Polyangiales bacterium]